MDLLFINILSRVAVTKNHPKTDNSLNDNEQGIKHLQNKYE